MMKKEDWKQARKFVLEHFPNAVCFRYKVGNFYAIFSDSDIIEAERLSNTIFEGKTAKNKEVAWIEAKRKIERGHIQEIEVFKEKSNKSMKL